jgi:hypothetical protein
VQSIIKEELQELSTFRPAQKTVGKHDNATAHLDIDDPERDGMTKAKLNIEISRGIKEGTLDPKVYRGEHGYQSYID